MYLPLGLRLQHLLNYFFEECHFIPYLKLNPYCFFLQCSLFFKTKFPLTENKSSFTLIVTIFLDMKSPQHGFSIHLESMFDKIIDIADDE